MRLELLLQYLREDPSDSFTRFAIAQEYVKQGDLNVAASYFEEIARADPQYVGTYYHLGKLYERLNRKGDAAKTYEAGILVAREQRDFHSLSELQAALQAARGAGWEGE